LLVFFGHSHSSGLARCGCTINVHDVSFLLGDDSILRERIFAEETAATKSSICHCDATGLASKAGSNSAGVAQRGGSSSSAAKSPFGSKKLEDVSRPTSLLHIEVCGSCPSILYS
jgi:hypothetical protein